MKIHYAAKTVEDECLGNPENILIGDTNNVMSFIWNIHYLWAIPFKVDYCYGLSVANNASASLVANNDVFPVFKLDT